MMRPPRGYKIEENVLFIDAKEVVNAVRAVFKGTLRGCIIGAPKGAGPAIVDQVARHFQKMTKSYVRVPTAKSVSDDLKKGENHITILDWNAKDLSSGDILNELALTLEPIRGGGVKRPNLARVIVILTTKTSLEAQAWVKDVLDRWLPDQIYIKGTQEDEYHFACYMAITSHVFNEKHKLAKWQPDEILGYFAKHYRRVKELSVETLTQMASKITTEPNYRKVWERDLFLKHNERPGGPMPAWTVGLVKTKKLTKKAQRALPNVPNPGDIAQLPSKKPHPAKSNRTAKQALLERLEEDDLIRKIEDLVPDTTAEPQGEERLRQDAEEVEAIKQEVAGETERPPATP